MLAQVSLEGGQMRVEKITMAVNYDSSQFNELIAGTTTRHAGCVEKSNRQSVPERM